MNVYNFETRATMKYYNARKWWIDENIITREQISADNLNDALIEFVKRVNEAHDVRISKNALKNKSPMWRDTDDGAEQVGYVITAKSEFYNDATRKSSMQNIELWTKIEIIKSPFAEAMK